MDAEKALNIIRNLHSKINTRLFDQLFESWSSTVTSLYFKYNHNTIEVFRYISRDNKIKLWNWIKSLGITNIVHLRESYCIISAIYNKITNDDIPENLRALVNKYKCDNMVCFIVDLDEKEFTQLVDWCKEWLFDLELCKAKASIIYYYKDKGDNVSSEEVKINNIPLPKSTGAKMAPFSALSNTVHTSRGSGELIKVSTTPRHISLKFPLYSKPLTRVHR